MEESALPPASSAGGDTAGEESAVAFSGADAFPQGETRNRRSTGLVLVVDDNEAIRQVASQMLAALGYSVACAVDGQEGVEYYRAHKDEIALVLLDMAMPRMDGRCCFRELRKIDPNARVLVSTGNAVQDSVREVLDAGAVGLLPKPYSFAQLAGVIDKVLRA